MLNDGCTPETRVGGSLAAAGPELRLRRAMRNWDTSSGRASEALLSLVGTGCAAAFLDAGVSA
jgi:hypothetical protein